MCEAVTAVDYALSQPVTVDVQIRRLAPDLLERAVIVDTGDCALDRPTGPTMSVGQNEALARVVRGQMRESEQTVSAMPPAYASASTAGDSHEHHM